MVLGEFKEVLLARIKLSSGVTMFEAISIDDCESACASRLGKPYLATSPGYIFDALFGVSLGVTEPSPSLVF